MKAQLKTARKLIAEGTMEEIEKAFDILFSVAEDKAAYRNQLTIIRSDYGQWKDRKIKQLDPLESEKNSVIDRLLSLISSLEKGDKTPIVSSQVKFLQGMKDAGSFVLDGLFDNKIAGFVFLLALWFGGGYLLGAIWAIQENKQITDDEFYKQIIIGRMQDEINREMSNPDGKVYFTCGDEFAFQFDMADQSWAEVPGEQYGIPPSTGNVAGIVPPAIVGLAVPAGYQLFKEQLKMAISTNKGNWKNLAYTLMFASGTGYGYYSTRRKYPACSDEEITERLRSTAFNQQLSTLIVNKLKHAPTKILPGVVLPEKRVILTDTTLIRGLKRSQ